MKPNFFIIGAPKCGTTAMSVYLRAHPNIFMSYPKEPHYFARDLHHHNATKSLKHYLSLFKTAAPNLHKAIGEASVWYLFSAVAIEQIYQFNPEAKIIVMLRNPIDIFESLHAQMLYNRYEDQANPEIAWGRQTTRADGRMIPVTCPEPKILQYKAVISLGRQIQRLYAIFPPDQVLTIVFEDFKHNPEHEYNRVLSFLGINAYHPLSFKPINERKKHRLQWLGDMVENPPNWLRIMAQQSRQRLGLGWGRLTDIIRKINSEKIDPQLLPLDLRKKIAGELTGDIQLLSEILDRDFSCWLNKIADTKNHDH